MTTVTNPLTARRASLPFHCARRPQLQLLWRYVSCAGRRCRCHRYGWLPGSLGRQSLPGLPEPKPKRTALATLCHSRQADRQTTMQLGLQLQSSFQHSLLSPKAVIRTASISVFPSGWSRPSRYHYLQNAHRLVIKHNYCQQFGILLFQFAAALAFRCR